MNDIVSEIIEKIQQLSSQKEGPVLIALDGKCGAGKTTLAEKISRQIDMNVIHADHFFLQPYQRTPERRKIPGGNIDHERLFQEVLEPVSAGKTVSYRPFECKKQDFGEVIFLPQKHVNLVEGSYSCHPELWKKYDLHIFLDVDYSEQMRRIERRNGKEVSKTFQNRWIPLEEKYFSIYKIQEHCELSFCTNSLKK